MLAAGRGFGNALHVREAFFKLAAAHLGHVHGELHRRMQNHAAAAESFRRALERSAVGPERPYLTRMLERVGADRDGAEC